MIALCSKKLILHIVWRIDGRETEMLGGGPGGDEGGRYECGSSGGEENRQFQNVGLSQN